MAIRSIFKKQIQKCMLLFRKHSANRWKHHKDLRMFQLIYPTRLNAADGNLYNGHFINKINLYLYYISLKKILAKIEACDI